MVPVDIDVTPMDNSKTSKQGVSRTYKGFDGYAPMMAYIGTECYAVNFELREGKQHCQNGTVEFLLEIINLCKKLTDKPLLVRLDSGTKIKQKTGKQSGYLSLQFNVFLERQMLQKHGVRMGI